MVRMLFLILLLFLVQSIFATSKIYLIRHSAVNLKSPGWCSSKRAATFKEEYSSAPIFSFEKNSVLSKIENYRTVDTVFCSTLPRAFQTAKILFEGKAELKPIDDLRELDYPVLKIPVLPLPLKVWLGLSRATWMAGINKKDKPSFRQKKNDIELLSKKLEAYSSENETTIVVAHGMVNRQLIRTLKKQGWKLNQFEGYKNLSVNCLIK